MKSNYFNVHLVAEYLISRLQRILGSKVHLKGYLLKFISTDRVRVYTPYNAIIQWHLKSTQIKTIGKPVCMFKYIVLHMTISKSKQWFRLRIVLFFS